MTAKTKRRKTKAGRPPKTKVQALGDHVLKAADALFLERGYGATSMASVASRARVAKQTLYSRYPDKAALFRHVIRRRIDAIAAVRRGPVATPDPFDDLRVLGAAALKAALEPGFVRLQRIVIGEAAHFPELAAMAIDNWGSGFVDICGAAIARAQSMGLCRTGDANAIAMVFLGALVGEPFHKALAGVEMLKTARERRSYLDTVWEVFCGGVANSQRR